MMEAALVLSVLAFAGTGAALFRSAPARLLRDAREAVDAVGSLEAEWDALKVRNVTFQTEIEGLLESIEKKRRQVSAAASRDRSGAGAEQDLSRMTADQLSLHYTNMARERGLLA